MQFLLCLYDFLQFTTLGGARWLFIRKMYSSFLCPGAVIGSILYALMALLYNIMISTAALCHCEDIQIYCTSIGVFLLLADSTRASPHTTLWD